MPYVIAILTYILYLLLRKKFKLNMISLFLFTLTFLSLYYVLTEDEPTPTRFATIESGEQLNTIWETYSRRDVTNDTQVTRTLSPYKAENSGIIEPNEVVSDAFILYSISGNKVIATQLSDLKIVNTLSYEGYAFKPILLMNSLEKLIVIGDSGQHTRVYIYNKIDFSLYKTVEYDAVYVTSRMIGNDVYVITSKIIEQSQKERPHYSVNGTNYYLPYKNIYYFNGTYPNNFVVISKVSTTDVSKIEVASFLGLGQITYFSQNHLYFAEQAGDNKTLLIKFADSELQLIGIQEVRGNVLDHYSLDEYKGNLRVATSTEDGQGFEANHMFVLNSEMKTIGKLEDFSKGNEIQAAAFIGDKAYIETFNILDPFYVIDLKDAKNPKIVSELKVDGYNTNFIPYDESHIIAFGLLLDDEKHAKGIKVSIYDVKIPEKVKILSQVTISYKEYNSAYSDALYDKKSLILDREQGTLGFPIIYWINQGEHAISLYKQFYLFYHIRPDYQLQLLGTVSHYEKNQANLSSDDIKGGLIKGNQLFTVSDKLIKQNHLPDLELVKELIL